MYTYDIHDDAKRAHLARTNYMLQYFHFFTEASPYTRPEFLSGTKQREGKTATLPIAKRESRRTSLPIIASPASSLVSSSSQWRRRGGLSTPRCSGRSSGSAEQTFRGAGRYYVSGRAGKSEGR